MSNVSLSKNLQIDLIDSINIGPDTTCVDTLNNEWMIPCIECFVLVEAIKKDKENCIEDNKKKDTIIWKLNADNKAWRKRAKGNTIIGVVLGVVATLAITQ